MQVRRHPQGLEILLFPAELLLFRGILQRILENYQQSLADLEKHLPKPSKDMEEEEWEEWRSEIRRFRGANQQHLEQWVKKLPQTFSTSEEPHIWLLTPDEMDPLLLVLNDHRLMLAEKHGVDDFLMEADVPGLSDPGLQQVLVEIHLLAWLIETILQAKSEP